MVPGQRGDSVECRMPMWVSRHHVTAQYAFRRPISSRGSVPRKPGDLTCRCKDRVRLDFDERAGLLPASRCGLRSLVRVEVGAPRYAYCFGMASADVAPPGTNRQGARPSTLQPRRHGNGRRHVRLNRDVNAALQGNVATARRRAQDRKTGEADLRYELKSNVSSRAPRGCRPRRHKNGVPRRRAPTALATACCPCG